jgi:hypothetical protein
MRPNSILTALFFGLFSLSFTLGIAQQEPTSGVSYNPDADENGEIATVDLMELLALYGNAFDAPDVASSSTIEQLSLQVEMLKQLVEAQAQHLQQLSQIIRTNEGERPPFVWDAERQLWVCNEPLVVNARIVSQSVSTHHVQSGTAKLGVLEVH